MPGINALLAGKSLGRIPKFLLSKFQRNSPCFILRLPLDIHVDQIFPYLFLEDILRLRRVNKAFFLLTHEPIIWKRFLPHLRTPIPPIRPTFRYTYDPMDCEVEQLVIRAISSEDNWRQPVPKIVTTRVLPTQYIVLELKFIPGGKYLLASVRDVCSYWFFLIIYCLDHPSGPFPLARLETEVKAFNIEAQYMNFEGKQVLMVAYARRYYDKPVNDDPSQYSGKHHIEPPYPMKQDICCFYFNLHVLDALSNPFITPGSEVWKMLAAAQGDPCNIIQYYRSKREIEPDSFSLFDMNGVPFLSVIHLFNTVTVANLTEKDRAIYLVLADAEGFEGRPFRIRAMRKLPDQPHMLIIRTVLLNNAAHLHLLEIYDLQPFESSQSNFRPLQVYQLDTSGDIAIRFRISNYGNPSSNSDEWQLPHDCHPPTPISIFMETSEPDGIKHWIVWPSYTTQHKRFFYSLDWVTFQTKHNSGNFHTHIVGGAFRSVAFTVANSDRTDKPALVQLRRYTNPEFQLNDYPIPRVDRMTEILRKEMPLRPPNPYCTLDLDPEMAERYRTLGVAALAWDEGSGRLCMASGNTLQIDLLDFGYGAPPDNRAVKWKKALAVFNESCYEERYSSEQPGMIHVRDPHHVPGEWSPYTKYRELGEIPVGELC